MPSYRLVFPVPEGTPIEQAQTAHIETDRFYAVGDELEHGGRRWVVAETPSDDPLLGETVDLLLWPAG